VRKKGSSPTSQGRGEKDDHLLFSFKKACRAVHAGTEVGKLQSLRKENGKKKTNLTSKEGEGTLGAS